MKLRQLQIKRILLFVCKPFAKKINFYSAQQLSIIANAGFIKSLKDFTKSKYLVQLFGRFNLQGAMGDIRRFLFKRIDKRLIRDSIDIESGKPIIERDHFIRKALATITFLLCLFSVNALPISSTAVGGNWNVGASWVGGAVPAAADDVTIVAGSTITLTAAANAKSISIAGNLTVNFTLTIANAGSITVNSGAVVVFNSTGKIAGGGTNANGIVVLISSGSNLSTANTLGFNATVGNTTSTGSFAIKPGSFTMTYSSGVNYTYNGTANQAAGTGLTQNTPANLIISNTGAAGSNTVSLGAATGISGNLTVSSGILALGANATIIAGNLMVNGTISGTASFTLTGSGSTINGTGTISNTGTLSITTGAKSFLSTATLSIAGPISIASGITVTNNGTMTNTNVATGIVGASASATWVNASNSTLNVKGPLLTAGTLTATANPNTVNYTGAAQTINPTSYFHLTLSGSGTDLISSVSTIAGNFTLSGTVSTTAAVAMTITGNITIGTGTTFNASTFTHFIAGNWINNGGTFAASTSTIKFNGSVAQTIGGTSVSIFYNLTDMNANVAGLSLSINTSVSDILDFSLSTSGITTGAFTLIITNATPLAAITGSNSTRYVIGNLQFTFPAGTTSGLLFPIGTASIYAPVTLDVTGVSGAVNITAFTTTGTPANENTPIANSSGIDQTKKSGNYWTLTKGGAGSLTFFDGIFDFTNATHTGTPANYKLRNYSASWADRTPVTFSTGTSIEVTGMVSFGDFECGEADPLPTVSTNPSNSTICTSNNTTFTSAGTGAPAPSVKWQRSSNGGATYVDITAALDAGTTYSGFTTNTLTLTGSTISLNNYYYRAVYTNINGSANSSAGILTVNSIPAVVTVSGGGTFCGGSTTITASGGGGGIIYFEGTTSNGTLTATPSTSQVVSSSGTYYFRSCNGGCWGAQGSVTVIINGMAPGTYSIGPTGNYTSITQVVGLLSACSLTGAYIFELQSTYVSTVETFPLAIPFFTGSSATKTVTIRPATGATNLSITSANATGTLNLNGATNIIFDGRPGGAGALRQLSIINTAAAGYTIQLIKDAINNAIKYCAIEGVTTSAAKGVIYFATTTGTTGNDNNIIDNCDIGAGASTPTNCVFSLGTAGKGNSSNTISNCTIHDFFKATGTTCGILMSTNSDAWTITGNSFYETATRTFTTANSPWCAINLTDKTSGNGLLISGNYIGGQAANAGGIAMNIAGKGVIQAIRITGGSGIANSIQGNTIANIAFTSSSVSIQSLIYHSDGSLNVGTTTGNIIGSNSGAGSIVYTSTAGLVANSQFSAVFLGGTVIAGVPEGTIGGLVNFQNNTVGALAINSVDSCQLRIVDFEQSLCTFTISNNTIGNSTANNIVNNTKLTTFGITGFAGGARVTHTISNNILQNFQVNNTGGGGSPLNGVTGIQAQGDLLNATPGVYVISGNTIHDFTSISKIPIANGSVISGIISASTSPGQQVYNNTIYNLTATDATVSQRIRGIIFTGATSGTNTIYKNIIRNLTVASTTGGIVRGIDATSGPVSIQNNMIVLGYNAAGASVTNSVEFDGIYDLVGANTYYYNSVNIIGTGVVSGTSNTYAYYGINPSSKIIKDNLFINSRSNATGAAKNYGITVANTTGLTSDYNDIYTSGTGGVFGNNGSDQATLSAWQSATSQDAHSINAAASFVNAATDLHLTASPSTANFLISNQGTPIAGITTDIDGNTRNAYTPDPGYDEFQGTGSWIGVTSTAWATSSNWDDNIIPTSSLNAKILNAPNMPLVTLNHESVNDLYITAPGTLTINGGNLQIAGSIYNTGTFNASAGSIEMNGTAAQTIPANTFVGNALNYLVVSNTSAGGLSLGGVLDIYGSVSYSGTGMTLNTNDNLTFKSTAANTAWLGDMTGNTITGKATVERYISSRKAWRFLSVPTNTTQTIRQTWQEGATGTGLNPVPGYGIQLSALGGTAAGFDLYSPVPSMKTYNSSTGAWVGVSGTANTIKATDGYMTFIRGDRTANSVASPVTSTTLRTKGTLYTGNQTPITVSAGQFVAIGNPYASAIDMRNITKTGVKDFFYVWDPALTGTNGYGAYQTFSNNGSGNYVITPGGGSYGASGSISNYIQSGLAFFMQGDVGGGSITFKEAAKTTGSSVASIAAPVATPQIRANLYGVNADNSTWLADGLLINYDDNCSNTVDDMDAVKQANGSENLSVKTSGKLLVVERRHTLTSKDTIFLNLTGVSARKYRFEFMADQLYKPGLSGLLIDNYLHITTPLYIDGTTDIDFSVTSAAASYAANRFMIVFSQLGTLPVTFTSLKAYPVNNNINVEWKVDNEMNIKQYETEKSVDGTQFNTLIVTAATANGGHSASYLVTDTHPVEGYNCYRIKSVDINGKTSYTRVVKVMMGSMKQDISVYPNPVVNGTINLQLTNQPEGHYRIRLLNKSGQLIMERQVGHSDGSSTETIQLNKYTPVGIFQLEIVKPDGTQSNINVVY